MMQPPSFLFFSFLCKEYIEIHTLHFLDKKNTFDWKVQKKEKNRGLTVPSQYSHRGRALLQIYVKKSLIASWYPWGSAPCSACLAAYCSAKQPYQPPYWPFGSGLPSSLWLFLITFVQKSNFDSGPAVGYNLTLSWNCKIHMSYTLSIVWEYLKLNQYFGCHCQNSKSSFEMKFSKNGNSVAIWLPTRLACPSNQTHCIMIVFTNLFYVLFYKCNEIELIANFETWVWNLHC